MRANVFGQRKREHFFVSVRLMQIAASNVYTRFVCWLQLRYIVVSMLQCFDVVVSWFVIVWLCDCVLVCLCICVSSFVCLRDCVYSIVLWAEAYLCEYMYAVLFEWWCFFTARIDSASTLFEFIISSSILIFYVFLFHTHRCFRYLNRTLQTTTKKKFSSVVVVNKREPHRIKTK